MNRYQITYRNALDAERYYYCDEDVLIESICAIRQFGGLPSEIVPL